MIERILTVAVWLVWSAVAPLSAQDPEPIPIGLTDPVVKDLNPEQQALIDSDFPSRVEEFTGLASKVVKGGDAFAGGKKLEGGQWRLGVFQGVEFAWAQARDPKLQPLILTIRSKGPIHALLVAEKKSPLTGFADLKGKNVHVLQGREHCRLFAHQGTKGDAKNFFGKLLTTSIAQKVLDDVLTDGVQAAVVDSAALESYQELHPARFKRLKVLAKSEQFPATVIAYRQGGLGDDVLKKFRDGMVKANQTDKGQRAMASVGIIAFEAVPADYAKLLANIVKAYPPPGK